MGVLEPFRIFYGMLYVFLEILNLVLFNFYFLHFSLGYPSVKRTLGHDLSNTL